LATYGGKGMLVGWWGSKILAFSNASKHNEAAVIKYLAHGEKLKPSLSDARSGPANAWTVSSGPARYRTICNENFCLKDIFIDTQSQIQC